MLHFVTCWWMFELVSTWVYFRWSCYEHLSISLCVDMFLFLMGEIAMSSTAAVQAKWGLNSARNQWHVLQSAFTISYFHQQYVWIPVVPYLASTHVISIFTFRSSSECAVPSHSILPYYMVTCDAEHFFLISFVYILLKKLVFWL